MTQAHEGTRRIVRLEAENVKRLTAVEITPDGNLILVGGKNGQGKTSVLDSIAMALGGKELCPEVPLRRGAKRGHVQVDLGDLFVRRTFTEGGGGTLTVTNKDGSVHRSPQAMLDKLVGRLSFDPLRFAYMSPREQLETLRGVVALDFTELEKKRARLYEDRTAAGRMARSLEARFESMAFHADAPAEEVSLGALLDEHRAAEAAQHELLRLEEEQVVAREAALKAEADLLECDREIEKARALLRDLERRREWLLDEIPKATQHVDALQDAHHAKVAALPDLEAIKLRMRGADEANRKVRDNAAKEALRAEVKKATAAVEKLGDEIDALDKQKADALAAAKFPVPGLGFGEGEVLLDGLPFAQASAAEQLRVSVAMGLALNPTLRVLLVRDGSLLDEDSLKLLAEMATAADAQVWLEVVRTQDVSVVIEDGHVAGQEAGDAAHE